MNYYPSKLIEKGHPQFAYYAYGKDYHDVMKSRLENLASSLGVVDVRYVKEEDDISQKHLGLICCDTVPMLDRYWAWRAGLGFIGKNTSLIIPGKGSYFFLGEIITDRSFTSYDQPLEFHCGRCEQCLHACPTGALGEPYRVDASKCLSYLTIENRGAIPDEYAGKMGDCIYGCDRCQQTCPHNRFAAPTSIEEFEPSEELLSMTADDWKQLTKEEYLRLFRGSAVKRAKYDGFKRNIDAALNGIDEA
jgi:epoxyqueuosine reductase